MSIKKSSVGLIALGVLAGCAVSPQKVPGRYSQTAPSGHETVQLNPDGSFIKYRDGREIAHGRWHLTHQFLDTGIELDTESAASVDASANEYRLTTRDGRPLLGDSQGLRILVQNADLSIAEKTLL